MKHEHGRHPPLQRLRRQVRQRQRLGLGVGQRPLRAGDPADGRAGRRAEHLPVQHPGPADVVRGARHRGRLARPPRRRRPHGRDEPADVGQGHRRSRPGRLPVLRLDAGAAAVAVPRGHHDARDAADRHLQRRVHGRAAAPALQEHHLPGRAVGAARHRPGRGREALRRAVQGQGSAARVQPQGVPDGARLRARPLRVSAADPRAPQRPRRRPHLHRRQQRGGIGLRLRRRDRLRVVPDHAVVVAGRGVRQVRAQVPHRPRDEEEALRERAGGGRARVDRHGDRRRVERRARVHRDVGTRRFADAGVPGPRVLRRDPRRAVRRAARQPVDRHADAHAAGGPAVVRVRVARRHQARDAAAGGSDRVVHDGRAGVRPGRPAADADLRDARPRHRHAGLADRAVRAGTTRTRWTAAR